MQRDREDGDSGPVNEAEALAIEALEGLIAAPPQKALPLVRKVLAGNQSERVKRRAVFVLGMIDLPEAGQLLAETAQKNGGALQREAIRALGIRGGRGQSATLQAIYRNGDARARRAVLEAFVISGDKAALVAVAKSASEPREARAAIRSLAAIGAVAELRELGQDGKHSKELMQAFAVAGDLEGLLKIARSDPSPSLRAEAARSIGIVGGDQSRQALRELYRDSNAEVRKAALDGMMISGDEQGVLALYRAETDTARKRELLRMLSVMGGDAALEAIDAALQGQAP
jgi:HEAT repeat protein